MNIGIFGDSYGLPKPEQKKGKHWAEHLVDFGYSVDNQCEEATSLYYTYSKYLKNKNLYDRIIFLITHPKNIYVPSLKNYPHITDHEAVIRLLAKAKEKNFTEQEIETLIALDYYYKYLNNLESAMQVRTFHECLSNSITDPHVLKIPSFSDSLSNVECSLHDIHMIDIIYFDINNLNIKYKDTKRSFVVNDLRHGHLNNENNFILAKKIKAWIDTGNFIFKKENFVISTDSLETNFKINYEL
jgi:hypothetical protein